MQKALGRGGLLYSPTVRGALDVWGKTQEDLSLKATVGPQSLHHPSVKGKDRQKCLWNVALSLPFQGE